MRLPSHIFFAVLCGSLTMAPLAGSKAASPAGTLTIAVASPASGSGSFQGKPQEEGVKLAVDEANAAGGINGLTLDLQLADDRNDKKTAAEQAQRLVADGKTLVVLGHRTSDTAIAAAPVYGSGGLPVITGSASAPAVTAGNPWSFRVIFGNSYQGAVLAEYAYYVLGARSVRIAHDGSSYGLSLVEGFKSAAAQVGLTLEREWQVPPSGPDYEGRLSAFGREARSDSPESIVFVAASEGPAVKLIQALRDAGDRSRMLGGQSIGNVTLNEHFKTLENERRQPGFYTDGLYVAAIALQDTGGEAAQHFYRRYRTAFGHDADPVAAAYYDATVLAIRGLRETGARGTDMARERKALRDWLSQFNSPQRSFSGTTGRIYFDADRSALKSVPIGRFDKGNFFAAPIQFELLAIPERVPNFDDEVKAGTIVKTGQGYMAKSQVIYVGMDIIGVSDINTRTAEFTADMFLWFRYRDSLPLKDLEFPDASRRIDLGDPVWVRHHGDMTVATYRVRGTFKTDFNYGDYPLDRQKLVVALRPKTRTASSLVLAIDEAGMSMLDRRADELALSKLNASFAASPWQPQNSIFYESIFKSDSTLGEQGLHYADAGLEYTQINGVVEIRRKIASFLIKNLLPLALILIVLYTSHFVPADQMSVRVSIGVTTLLTTMVLYQRVSADLPSIGYLVLMDYGFFAVFGLAILHVALSVTLYLAGKAKNPTVERAANIGELSLIPLALLIGLIILWHF